MAGLVGTVTVIDRLLVNKGRSSAGGDCVGSRRE